MGEKKRIKDMLRDEAEASRIRQGLAGMGRERFIAKVMQEDGLTAEETYALCLGQTDPPDPKYTLGWKLADPVWSVGILFQPGKRARSKAAENFRATLTAEEAELFDEYCAGKKGRELYRKARKEYKAEKRRRKAEGKEAADSELDGEDGE